MTVYEYYIHLDYLRKKHNKEGAKLIKYNANKRR
jgi:hypothetical protein